MNTTAPILLVNDFRGQLVTSDGIAYYLTPCCQASGKGSGDGIVCRACYRPVADTYGMGWLVTDTAMWDHYAADLVADLAPYLPTGLSVETETAPLRAAVARMAARAQAL